MKPTPAKPRSITAQVEGSGTDGISVQFCGNNFRTDICVCHSFVDLHRHRQRANHLIIAKGRSIEGRYKPAAAGAVIAFFIRFVEINDTRISRGISKTILLFLMPLTDDDGFSRRQKTVRRSDGNM
jgi:hypothetical protein